jgi:3-dehydroquinate dehydratase-1
VRIGFKIPALVGVISSRAELQMAGRMRALPDLFELRLDYLPALSPSATLALRRPVIITARHPAEGGSKSFRNRRIYIGRRQLLLKFLPYARAVDVELRSLGELREVWKKAARGKAWRICSLHDFRRQPRLPFLRERWQQARDAGADVFKLVARADTLDDLLTLVEFLRHNPRGCAVMAIGKFGPISRLLFPQCGSLLLYAPLRRRLHEGQLTFGELAKLRDFYTKEP